jgi:hypothetical protein
MPHRWRESAAERHVGDVWTPAVMQWTRCEQWWWRWPEHQRVHAAGLLSRMRRRRYCMNLRMRLPPQRWEGVAAYLTQDILR